MMIKTPEQIAGIRRSCQLAADALDYIEPHVVPGVTTEHLNQLLETWIVEKGAVPAPKGYLGFPKATCISLNEVICHGIPGDDVLKEGDIVNIDVTTIRDGYYGDTSRMFAVGEISDDARKIIAIAKDCLDIGIGQVRPGNAIGNISKAITQYAHSRGCSVVYQFCGHGTGVAFHEPPQIQHAYRPEDYDPRPMQPGMVFTIEPMLNLGLAEAVVDPVDKWTARTKDGKLSAQFEHTILVTEDGSEVLTK